MSEWNLIHSIIFWKSTSVIITQTETNSLRTCLDSALAKYAVNKIKAGPFQNKTAHLSILSQYPLRRLRKTMAFTFIVRSEFVCSCFSMSESYFICHSLFPLALKSFMEMLCPLPLSQTFRVGLSSVLRLTSLSL